MEERADQNGEFGDRDHRSGAVSSVAADSFNEE
jgi:hypothetical protein